jgi:hypothetical protein
MNGLKMPKLKMKSSFGKNLLTSKLATHMQNMGARSVGYGRKSGLKANHLTGLDHFGHFLTKLGPQLPNLLKERS